MNPIELKTLRQIISENLSAADVFYQHGIDLFTDETKTLAETCQQQSLNLNFIEKELLASVNRGTKHYTRWEPDYLIDHIVNKHHYFVWVNLPVIKEYALKVSRAQGQQYPVTIQVNRLFKELATEMETHLDNQEHHIFPYIKRLVFAKRDKQQVEKESLELSVLSMKAEFECFTAKINLMVSLLKSADISNQPGSTASVLLYKLRLFKHDFYQHVHLESNILFPQALKLETEIGSRENN